jgi:hypothetical protein
MTRKHRETETFSLSFLDAITCAFGAVILLLVLTKIYEPQTIERSKENLAGLIAALQAQLFELRGETVVMNRDLVAVEEQLSESKEKVARLGGDVSKIRGQFSATSESARIEDEERGDLEGARQKLLADMPEDFAPERSESIIGGIPVDSQYIIFVIDRSGSMQAIWPTVLRKVNEVLNAYPDIKGIQVFSDNGDYLFSSFAGKWIADSMNTRKLIRQKLGNWQGFSPSNPARGIQKAISTFYDPEKRISIYVFGDDVSQGGIEGIVSFVERVNKADEFGNRLVRIHALAFISGLAGRPEQFSNLMRVLADRNGGTFVALTQN